jgi:hypothetical protein
MATSNLSNSKGQFDLSVNKQAEEIVKFCINCDSYEVNHDGTCIYCDTSTFQIDVSNIRDKTKPPC